MLETGQKGDILNDEKVSRRHIRTKTQRLEVRENGAQNKHIQRINNREEKAEVLCIN